MIFVYSPTSLQGSVVEFFNQQSELRDYRRSCAFIFSQHLLSLYQSNQNKAGLGWSQESFNVEPLACTRRGLTAGQKIGPNNLQIMVSSNGISSCKVCPIWVRIAQWSSPNGVLCKKSTVVVLMLFGILAFKFMQAIFVFLLTASFLNHEF